MSTKLIPLSVPNINGNEWQYIKDCLDTGWIKDYGLKSIYFNQKLDLQCFILF
jgi:perosamine synthetase